MSGSKLLSILEPVGEFPSTLDTDLYGGYRVVQDQTELIAIPLERIKVGMVVYVIFDDLEYRYVGTVSVKPDGNTSADTNVFPTNWTTVNTSGIPILTNITYSALKTLMTNNDLEIGYYYRIIDFKSTWIDYFDSPIVQFGPVEPIIVQAVSENKLSSLAVSSGFYSTEINPNSITLFPNIGYSNDIIYVNIDIPTVGHPFYGNITSGQPDAEYRGQILWRFDSIRNISAYYDWRHILVRKWQINTEEVTTSNFDYSQNYPYIEWNLTSISLTYPLKALSIQVKQEGAISTTVNIIPNRYLRNIYEIVWALNEYFNSTYHMRFEVRNSNRIHAILTDWIKDPTLKPLWTFENMTLTSYNDVISSTITGTNVSNTTTQSQKFYTFDNSRIGQNPSLLPVLTEGSGWCKNIKIGKVISNLIPDKNLPGFTISGTNNTNYVNINPLYLNNILFDNKCKNIKIKDNSQHIIFAFSENITIDNEISQCRIISTNSSLGNKNIDILKNSKKNFIIDCNNLKIENNSYQNYIDTSNKIKLCNGSNYSVIGNGCDSLNIGENISLFTNIGSNISNKTVNEYFSNFEFNVISGLNTGVNGYYRLISGSNYILYLPGEHFGIIKYNLSQSVNDLITEIRCLNSNGSLNPFLPKMKFKIVPATNTIKIRGTSVLVSLSNFKIIMPTTTLLLETVKFDMLELEAKTISSNLLVTYINLETFI